jgi:RNA polymerase sigma-70 factor (ECF subfamily)
MADETKTLVQSLVERAQAGDGGAFGELYEQFAPEIFRYLLRHLNGRRESAEDLTEEVFVKVLERLGSYQFRGLPFSAWLYRIARNHMIDHLRSRPRQVISSLDQAPEIPEKKAEQTMDRSLDRHELTYALDRLTSDQRHVVTLRFLDGFTTAETAEIMGKTEDAVKKLQARGLVQLRRIIETARRAEDAPPVAAPAAPQQAPRRLSALGAA